MPTTSVKRMARGRQRTALRADCSSISRDPFAYLLAFCGGGACNSLSSSCVSLVLKF